MASLVYYLTSHDHFEHEHIDISRPLSEDVLCSKKFRIANPTHTPLTWLVISHAFVCNVPFDAGQHKESEPKEKVLEWETETTLLLVDPNQEVWCLVSEVKKSMGNQRPDMCKYCQPILARERLRYSQDVVSVLNFGPSASH